MPMNDLILNGEIILEGDVLPHDYCAYMAGGCFSARMVREALAAFSGDVTIRINSGGGDPHEGEAIRAAIEAHPGNVTIIVAGVAASSASLLIMSANRIEMTAGSFLMIHNPRSCIFEDPNGLRKEADVLDQLIAVYAAVYAKRSGMTSAEIIRLMAETKWFGPQEAVASGFADAVVGDVAAPDLALAAVMSMHQTSISNLRMCADKFKAAGQSATVQPTGTPGQSRPSMAASKEAAMPQDENPAVVTPATTAVAPAAAVTPVPAVTMQAPDAAAIAERGRVEERDRQRGIRQMAQPFMAAGQLTEAQVNAVIDEGLPLASVGNRFMSVMAAAETPVGAARITRDETDTQIEGLVSAMMQDYTGAGQQYRGMRLRSLAMHLAGPQRGFDQLAAIQRGFRSTTMMGGAHGVSDFSYITTEVMNRSLQAEYTRRGANWNVVTGAPLNASDFREIHAVRFGGDFQLKAVKENGEYQEATLNDEAEGLKVERRGRTIHLTFEAVVNDDMGAFNRIPREFAMAARVMENSMVWGIIRSNAVLKSDSKALFHADHKNLAAANAAISVASVGLGRKAMWEQGAFGSKDKDDFLQVVADQLIVPPALEILAMQFATGTVPTKDADTNPFKNTLTPVVVPNLGLAAGGSDTAWYLVSSDLPPVSVAYLDGYQSPTVQTIEGMNPDRVTMNARHIFGAAPSEYRGSFKNAGA